MKARLVQLAGDRKVRSVRVEDRPITLGRDPACDVPIASERVSRQHARIELLGGVHYLVDEGSANGTQHRGRPVEGRVVLEPGDRFQLADEVAFRYETEREMPWWAIAVAVVVVAGAVAGALLLSGGDPAWDEALLLAEEAVAADEARDYGRAHDKLRAAVGHLLREGRLDDVPRSQAVEVALARIEERLQSGKNLEALLERSERRSEPVEMVVEGECRLDEVSVDGFDRCLHERVEQIMIGLRQDPGGVPDRFYGEVARRMKRERRFLNNALGRGLRYREMMTEELKRAYMPPLLHYLSCIESGYKTEAKSHAGALGLWQFMPGTARDYGLRVGGAGDERKDPQRSTMAAARYLRSLAFEFGGESLMLVLASYNRGENGVRRALKRLEDPYSDRSYWALVDAGLLPQETADYVTRYFAAAVAGEAGLPSVALLTAAGY
ncbi:MAG: transglycosylase SLT domain-containing protein [Myxococcota bacterium]